MLTFSSKREWESHIQQVHLKEPPMVRSTKLFHCDMCNKAFSWKQALKRHQNLHNQQKVQVCPVCKKKFADKFLLRRHMRIHPDENYGAVENVTEESVGSIDNAPS